MRRLFSDSIIVSTEAKLVLAQIAPDFDLKGRAVVDGERILLRVENATSRRPAYQVNRTLFLERLGSRTRLTIHGAVDASMLLCPLLAFTQLWRTHQALLNLRRNRPVGVFGLAGLSD